MTTQWQSMFDTGPCYLLVNSFTGESPQTRWEGYLAKGESSPEWTSNGSHFVLKVDADGVVTLSSSDGGSPANKNVIISPDADMSVLMTRIADVSIFAENGTSPLGSSTGSLAITDLGDSVALDDSTAPTTPSFGEFAAGAISKPPAGYIGVSCGGIG